MTFANISQSFCYTISAN